MIEVIIAIVGLTAGDAIDPLSLNTDDDSKSVLFQEQCESTATTQPNGEKTIIKTCKTMRTTNTIEDKD